MITQMSYWLPVVVSGTHVIALVEKKPKSASAKP